MSDHRRTITKANISSTGNGYIVDAEIISDLGDGVPWPYQHKSVYLTWAEIVTALTPLFEERERATATKEARDA